MLIFTGSLFTIIFTVFLGIICGSIFWFLDLVSLIIVLVSIFFFLSATKSGKIIGGYISSSFKKDYKYSASELKLIAKAVSNTRKVILAAGWFGVLFGIIATLRNLSVPEQLGPALSISLITILYAVAINYFIFFPVQVWAENKCKE